MVLREDRSVGSFVSQMLIGSFVAQHSKGGVYLEFGILLLTQISVEEVDEGE